MNVHHLTLDHVGDDVLMSRLYELARNGRQTVETAQIDAEVYTRLMQTYGETAPDTAQVAA
jgi:hypothetical protein